MYVCVCVCASVCGRVQGSVSSVTVHPSDHVENCISDECETGQAADTILSVIRIFLLESICLCGLGEILYNTIISPAFPKAKSAGRPNFFFF